MVTDAPASSPVPTAFKPQTEAAESEKPPQMQVDDLLKKLSYSMSSGPQGSKSTNTLDNDAWRGFMADLNLPMACEDSEGGRPGEDELLGSWLADELLGNSKDSPGLGDGGSDMMYIGPTMARFLESHSTSEANVTKSDDSKTESRAAERDACWQTESTSEFLFDTNQSIVGAPEEVSPMGPGERRARTGSNGHGFPPAAATETPAFPPREPSSDATPEPVCSAEGSSGNPKRLLNTASAHTTDSQVAHKSAGSTEGPCYANVEEQDALLMYMMSFDDEMPASRPDAGKTLGGGAGAGQMRIRENSSGFTGLDSRSLLSDEFWSRPFVTRRVGLDPRPPTPSTSRRRMLARRDS